MGEKSLDPLLPPTIPAAQSAKQLSVGRKLPIKSTV